MRTLTEGGWAERILKSTPVDMDDYRSISHTYADRRISTPESPSRPGRLNANAFGAVGLMLLPCTVEAARDANEAFVANPSIHTGAAALEADANAVDLVLGIAASAGSKFAARASVPVSVVSFGAGHVANVTSDRSTGGKLWYVATHNPAWGLGQVLGWFF
jgi:hypothetical protein